MIRSVVTKYFFVFITQLFYLVSEDVRLNTTYFFIMKIPNRWELQQISLIIHVILASINLKRFTEKQAKTIEELEREGGWQFEAIQSYFCYVSNK